MGCHERSWLTNIHEGKKQVHVWELEELIDDEAGDVPVCVLSTNAIMCVGRLRKFLRLHTGLEPTHYRKRSGNTHN